MAADDSLVDRRCPEALFFAGRDRIDQWSRQETDRRGETGRFCEPMDNARVELSIQKPSGEVFQLVAETFIRETWDV